VKMHTSYMIALSVLFAVVFVIMIGSLIWHRRRCLRAAAGFSGLAGTHGAGQWFWALLPLLILAGINLSLLQPLPAALATAPQKIKLAAATAQVEHAPRIPTPAASAEKPGDGHARP
jgi:heme/copper-type cytochrome/quinol oxidase subunit 2